MKSSFLKFNQKEFENFIQNSDIINFFEKPIKFSSGRESHEYIDWRSASKDTFLINKLTDFIINFAKQKFGDFDTFCGVPESATKVALITQLKWGIQNYETKGSHSLPMLRRTDNEIGLNQNQKFLGKPTGRVIVIEDVTTTGNSLLNTLEYLREENVNVIGVIVLTNRMERRDDGRSVEEVVIEKGYEFYYMSSSTKILPKAFKNNIPSLNKKIGREIEKYYEKYGLEKMKLIEDEKN